ncbi:TonB-dependent receptor domain-containing protein [Novosphingobium terrae]|uniref:TonB-dependent receptor domain-containing protein n=1 Tax=Novosphingobium terrae TaxID=2726189 RepID=UPI00197ECDED|nr:TonB-dependent receptor [Novosphingobium terrae]
MTSASLGAMAAPVFAQDSAPAAPAVESVSAPAATNSPGDKDIIVTGSRTVKNGNDSPTPVTVVTTDALSNVRPTSLTDSIQVMPVFSGSRGLSSNPTATGTTGGGNGSAAQMNLRNVGANRTLVLMDGKRVPPTSFTNIVDADVIPQLLIKRVDLVTGGVSAVYGSDAVSGVVNFITDTTFTGFKAQASGGISSRHDDPTADVGLAWGKKLGDSSHFEVSYEYRYDGGIDRRSSRDWLNRTTIGGNGSTIPYYQIPNSTLSAQPFGGRITCGTGCALNGQYFASNGVLSPFVNGTTYTGSTTQSGGAGGYYDDSLKASLKMHQVYARFDTDLSDSISAYVLASGTFKTNGFYGNDVLLSGITLNRNNAFLPAAYTAQIPTATFTYNQMFNQNARLTQEADSRQLMFAGGFKGTLAGAAWNVDYTHGDSRLTTTLQNNLNYQKLSAALDAVVGPNGTPVCYASTQAATAAAYANCVPLNVFGPSAASPAAVSYIFDTTRSVATTRQDDVTASISKSPFSTWAGAAQVALSGEWRRQTFISTSNGTPSQTADCTNLRYNCITTGGGQQLLLNTFAPSPHISMSVWEGAVEATVPLLKDVRFFRAFDLTGAARYTKYDTVGGYATWKAGFNWEIDSDLRLRGTISRDIRAPTLFDLFAPTTTSYSNYTDIKTGTSSFVPQYNLSNPNLTAEIGHTKTIGVVWKPHYMRGFSLAVDYYRINISNAIATVQGTAAQTQSACNTANVALYCSLIIRNSAGAVDHYIQVPINLAQIQTYGVDVEANYQGRVAGHPLSLRGLAAYQPHIRYIQPNVPTIDQGDVAFGANGLTASPSWRLTGMLSYMPIDKLRIDVLERWRNAMKMSGDPTVTFAPGNGTMPAYGTTSLNVAVDVNPQAEFYINIQNIFDAAPPPGNLTGSSGTPGQWNGFAASDDVVGRYFTVGVKLKM